MTRPNRQEDTKTKAHLVERYEEMIDVQIHTIDGIDEKAAQASRLITLLAGLILTVTSVLVTTEAFQITAATVIGYSMIGLGSVSLFVALVAAIITYLSSKFLYGPKAVLGRSLINADSSVGSEEYMELLLRGYSTAITTNKRVIERNADRFRWSLLFLLVSLFYLFGGGWLLVLPGGTVTDILVFGLVTLAALLASRYIYRKEYLTIERTR